MTRLQLSLLGVVAVTSAGCSSSPARPPAPLPISSAYDPAYQLVTETREMVTGKVECAGDVFVQGTRSGSGFGKVDAWTCEDGKAVHREYWFDDKDKLESVVEHATLDYHDDAGFTTTGVERFIRNDAGEFVIGGGRGATASAEKRQALQDAAKAYIRLLLAKEPPSGPTPR